MSIRINPPHVIDKTSTKSIMLDVIIAMIPAMAVSVLFFGLNAMLVIITSVTACIALEYMCSIYWLKTKNNTQDLSAIVTGILLAFCLPGNLPLWMVIIGAFIAIVVTKMAFGGLGRNIFNPALAGRTFLFLAFPVQMTLWPKPNLRDFWNYDIKTGATALEIIKYSDVSTSATRLDNNEYLSSLPDYYDMFIGYISGSVGEISVAAILIGFFYLLYKKVITWHVPVFYMGTVFLIMYAVSLNSAEPIKYNSFLHVLSGGLMLGAVFMATDYTTSPMTAFGRIIFAVGCGVLTVLIRLNSVYMEGVAFSILIMNAFVPLIDKFTKPRIFGTGRK
ncbi:MAG: RnfABCDGE type electron transport complex subunit D [Lactobacillaceae bacterium]|jgi:electron transport complex protein RnfD|nr:RnfABCDGE type electron transport complex subunit D [Lactobacillaceae bacterium]